MSTLVTICQIAIAAGIFNVWVVRARKATAFRPQGARSLQEEFETYGFPEWFRRLIGAAKLGLAALIVAGIWYPVLAVVGGFGLAVLMAGAVAAHWKVRDPITKSVPALSLLALSVFVALSQSG